MHFKANAAGCHRIPQARYLVIIWPVYEAGLRRRDNLTLWLDQDDFVGWAAPGGNTPGGQSRYSDSAIELVLFLRLMFDLALRPGSSLDDRARVDHGARGIAAVHTSRQKAARWAMHRGCRLANARPRRDRVV